MGCWCYGLVREGKGDEEKLVVCEVFFNDDESPYGYAYVKLKDTKIKGDKLVILTDLMAQISEDKIFKEGDFK